MVLPTYSYLAKAEWTPAVLQRPDFVRGLARYFEQLAGPDRIQLTRATSLPSALPKTYLFQFPPEAEEDRYKTGDAPAVSFLYAPEDLQGGEPLSLAAEILKAKGPIGSSSYAIKNFGQPMDKSFSIGWVYGSTAQAPSKAAPYQKLPLRY
jgi:hypothetical protein